MKLLKKLPKAVILIAAALVVMYIIITLVGHFSASSRISNKKQEIQHRQEMVFSDDQE